MVYGGFLSHGGSQSHHGVFQYKVMVVHDDWMIAGGYPHDLGNLHIYQLTDSLVAVVQNCFS